MTACVIIKTKMEFHYSNCSCVSHSRHYYSISRIVGPAFLGQGQPVEAQCLPIHKAQCLPTHKLQGVVLAHPCEIVIRHTSIPLYLEFRTTDLEDCVSVGSTMQLRVGRIWQRSRSGDRSCTGRSRLFSLLRFCGFVFRCTAAADVFGLIVIVTINSRCSSFFFQPDFTAAFVAIPEDEHEDCVGCKQ